MFVTSPILPCTATDLLFSNAATALVEAAPTSVRKPVRTPITFRAAREDNFSCSVAPPSNVLSAKEQIYRMYLAKEIGERFYSKDFIFDETFIL